MQQKEKSMGDSKKGFNKYLGLTFLIGFGFFTMGLMDILYDTYVPVFLGDILKKAGINSNALVGFIMTLDNILAIFLIPLVSVWSDNTRTKIGRRMPYIITLLPLSAICFSLIPYAAGQSLFALILVIVGLNIFKQSVRGPIVALMPDTIPGEYRSEANGIINTMGALGSIISTIGLARLMDLNVVLPLLGQTKDRLPFPVAGLLVVVATILVFCFVHEQNSDESAREEKIPVIQSIKEIAGQKDKSALWILLSLFFWFLGYQGILPFVAKMSIDILHTSKANAALPAAAVGIAQAVFAIPAGYVAHKIGRRKTIRISLIVVTSLLVLGGFLASPAAASIPTQIRFFSFLGMMFVYGIFWIAIITNSFPMLWQMATYGSMGIYTGLYYTFSQAAAIVSPTITGGLIDLVGYSGIFVFAAVCMLVAFYFMSRVTKGEPAEKPTKAAA
jgi:MFS family permease